jgi:hypothetical protein
MIFMSAKKSKAWKCRSGKQRGRIRSEVKIESGKACKRGSVQGVRGKDYGV